MKTYSFKVVVEPDDDRWHAYCPALQQYGASTWGNTEEEAFKHIHEVVRMIIAELTEDGIAVPEGPREDVEVPWYDDEPGGGQDLFIVRETRLAAGRAGEGSEQPAGVGNDWGTHPSRSRNSSDACPNPDRESK